MTSSSVKYDATRVVAYFFFLIFFFFNYTLEAEPQGYTQQW